MNYADVNPRLAEWAAKKAITILTCRDVSSRDREDMTQEAALTIWRVAHRADGEGYLYNAGKNAALLWWRYYVAQVKDYHDAKKGGFVGKMISLDDDRESRRPYCEAFAAPEEESHGHYELVGGRKGYIRKMLKQHGPWKKKRARIQAMQVLDLVLAGHNNHSIALELGITYWTVCAYRRQIRTTLQRALDLSTKAA